LVKALDGSLLYSVEVFVAMALVAMVTQVLDVADGS